MTPHLELDDSATVLDAIDQATAKRPMATEKDIVEALRARYLNPSQNNGAAQHWVFCGQVSVSTSWEQQRMDAFAMSCWLSEDYRRHAFEVKCTRSDLRSELAAPHKRERAMSLAEQFYFVVDHTVNLDGLEIPDDCGLMIHTEGRIRIKRRAPMREVPPLAPDFAASLLRTIQRQEIRRSTGADR